MDQIFYTISQCCRLAAIGRTKFYELIANGEIPVRKVGKKTLVSAADLERWVERLPATKPRALDQSNSTSSRARGGVR
jgi:excisionase family DNA binding protein